MWNKGKANLRWTILWKYISFISLPTFTNKSSGFSKSRHPSCSFITVHAESHTLCISFFDENTAYTYTSYTAPSQSSESVKFSFDGVIQKASKSWICCFPDTLFLFVSSWSYSHHHLWVSCNVARHLSAVFYHHPLRVLAGSGLWLLQDWGWRDEVAFNQQLAPHKAFITPKRLHLLSQSEISTAHSSVMIWKQEASEVS